LRTGQTVPAFPDEAELAALRGRYAGLDTRSAVARYLGDRRAVGTSSRGVLGRVRRQLIKYAQMRHRGDPASVFVDRPTETSASRVTAAIETLRNCRCPAPMVADLVELWLPARIAAALCSTGCGCPSFSSTPVMTFLPRLP